MSITKTVARNTIIQVIGRILYLITSLAIVKLLTGALSQSGFGQYNFLVDYLGFFGVVVDFGLYLIVIQRIHRNKNIEMRERSVGEVVLLRIILASVSFSIAILGSIFMPVAHEMHQALIVGSFGFFAFSAGQIFSGISQGYYRAEFGSLAELLGKMVTLLCIFILSVYNLPFVFAAFAILVGNTVTFLLAWQFSRQFIRVRLSFSLDGFRRTLLEALPLGLVISFSYLHVRQDTFFLSFAPHFPDWFRDLVAEKHYDGTFQAIAVGIYKAPFKLLETLQGMPYLFITALFPFLTKYIEDDDQRLKGMLQKSFEILALFALPIITFSVLLAPNIIRFLTDGDYSPSVPVLQILIFAIAFSFTNTLFSHFLIAKKAQRVMVLPSLFYLLFNAGLNYILIPRYAYIGASIATVATEMIIVVVSFYFMHRYLDWKPSLRKLPLAAVFAMFSAILSWGMIQIRIPFLISGFVGFSLYLVLVEWVRYFPEGVSLRMIIKKFISK